MRAEPVGLWGLARFLRALRPRLEEARRDRPDGVRRALQGSAFWWGLVLLVGPGPLPPVL